MRALERLATYWLWRLIVADLVALALLAVAAVAGIRLYRECLTLVGW